MRLDFATEKGHGDALQVQVDNLRTSMMEVQVDLAKSNQALVFAQKEWDKEKTWMVAERVEATAQYVATILELKGRTTALEVEGASRESIMRLRIEALEARVMDLVNQLAARAGDAAPAGCRKEAEDAELLKQSKAPGAPPPLPPGTDNKQ